MAVRSVLSPRVRIAGLQAGLVGALTLDAYLIVQSALEHHGSLAAAAIGGWQFIASAAIGPAAYSSASFALLGLLLHLTVSIAWATGFASLATTRSELTARPFLSGIGFGLVVWFLMQLVLIAPGLFRNPSPEGFVHALISHCLFFGVPVAYMVRRALPA